jgi:hypothetical protein
MSLVSLLLLTLFVPPVTSNAAQGEKNIPWIVAEQSSPISVTTLKVRNSDDKTTSVLTIILDNSELGTTLKTDGPIPFVYSGIATLASRLVFSQTVASRF